MNSVWRSLLWKEWREHRWKLLAFTAIAVVAPALVSIRSRDMHAEAVTFTLALLVPLAAIFLGMHAAASEQSRGTIRFLQTLPTPMARPATAKLLIALLTLSIVVLAAVGVAALWSDWIAPRTAPANLNVTWEQQAGGAWGLYNWYGGVLVSSIAGGASILLWMMAAGVNRSDEVRAGALGVLAMLVCWAALLLPEAYHVSRTGHSTVGSRWHGILSAAAPAGPAAVYGPQRTYFDNRPIEDAPWLTRFLPFLAAAVVSHGALAAWYVGRFGRIPSGALKAVDPTAQNLAVAPMWLGTPRRTPLTALIWKQLRETVPLPLLGAATITLAAIWAAGENWESPSYADTVMQVSYAVWITMGSLVAVVAAIGAFMDDLRPGLHTFWRSRPIPVNQWFAVKFAFGLLSTIVVLAIPPCIVAVCLWNELDGIMKRGDNLPVIFSMTLALHAALFAAASAAMTLVRHAIYAAVLTTCAVWSYCTAIVIASELLAPQWEPASDWLATTLLFGVPTVAMTIVAWLAVRNDWGWKG